MNKIVTILIVFVVIFLAVYIVYASLISQEQPSLETDEVQDNAESTVKVFYGNSGKIKLPIDCSKVYAVERRVLQGGNLKSLSLEELLKGPTEEEKSQGYFTAIDEGVKVNSLSIENQKVKVDFSEELESDLGGSCAIVMIRSQIEETLRQFSDVTEIEISIEGKTESMLQP